MKFSFEGKCVLTLEHKEGMSNSKHVSTDFNLIVPSCLDYKMYIDKNGLPTKNGSEVLTNVFIQGLVGNIHQCHENAYRDSAEHLRYIISEIERGFVTVTEITPSNFDD